MKRRADDTVKAVTPRLEAYHARTALLMSYSDGQAVLQRLDEMSPIDDIASTLGTVVHRATAI